MEPGALTSLITAHYTGIKIGTIVPYNGNQVITPNKPVPPQVKMPTAFLLHKWNNTSKLKIHNICDSMQHYFIRMKIMEKKT